MPGPLEGYSVIDLCRAGPGRHATGILADYGAQVISIVQPGYAQISAPGEGGLRRGDTVNSRNKRSLFLNMRADGALEVFMRLVKESDALLESNRPGAAQRLGIDYQSIKKTNPNPEITIIASGSEVQIAIDALNKLKEANINSKVVSMPCQELFDKQPKEYREKIIEKNSKKISIEASSVFGWEKYVGSEGSSLGMKSFGKSAPYKTIYEDFNLTSNSVVMIAKKMLGK